MRLRVAYFMARSDTGNVIPATFFDVHKSSAPETRPVQWSTDEPETRDDLGVVP